MKCVLLIACAAFSLGMLAGCTKSPLLPSAAKEQRVNVVRFLPPQALAARGGNMLLGSGKVDGVEYVLLTSTRLFPQDGMLALCIATRLLSGTDVTQKISAEMKRPANTVTLRRLNDGMAVTLSPSFVPVVFKRTPPNKEGHLTFVPSDLGEVTGQCVVTDAPWQEQWRGNYGGTLALSGLK